MPSLVTFSEVEPAHKDTGKVWIKPSISQAFIRLSSEWRPFAGGDTIHLFTYPLTIFIRGIDRTPMTKIQSFEKTDFINEKVDTLTFILDDKDNIVNLKEGEEVLVFRMATPTSTPEVWFAGMIDELEPLETYSGSLKFLYNVNCVDYSKRLNQQLAVEEYDGDTSSFILNDLLEKYAEEFYYDYKYGTPIVDSIKFNYKPIGDCIAQIAGLVDYQWYIDNEKELKFFIQSEFYAPYTLTESLLTTGNYKNLVIKVNKTQLRNRIIVKGGTYLSGLFTEEFIADGVQTSFLTNYKPGAPISVYVDTGAGYVQKTLGLDIPTTTGVDFVVNYSNKFFHNLDHATLSAGHKFKVTYRYEIQVLTQDDDLNSQKLLRNIEGGSGVYTHLVTDTSIITIDSAHLRAQTELVKYSSPIIEGSFITDQDGYRSGQTLIVNMPSWGYGDYEFMIQKVISRLQNSNKFYYEIHFATKLKTLTELFTRIVDAVFLTTGFFQEETLHDLQNGNEDQITLQDATPSVFEERDMTANPWKWGADADSGAWSNIQWG